MQYTTKVTYINTGACDGLDGLGGCRGSMGLNWRSDSKNSLGILFYSRDEEVNRASMEGRRKEKGRAGR
jgi:hypothetical protein